MNYIEFWPRSLDCENHLGGDSESIDGNPLECRSRATHKLLQKLIGHLRPPHIQLL